MTASICENAISELCTIKRALAAAVGAKKSKAISAALEALLRLSWSAPPIVSNNAKKTFEEYVGVCAKAGISWHIQFAPGCSLSSAPSNPEKRLDQAAGHPSNAPAEGV